MKFGRLSLALVATLAACKSVPEGRVGVAAIRFRGNDELAGSDLEERIATRETPKFMGLFRASWRRYEDFEPQVLQKDLERIERYYRRRGYYGTEVRAGRVVPRGDYVDVEILIREGPPVHVRAITLQGTDDLRKGATRRAREGIQLDEGDVFDEAKLEQSTKAMAAVLANLGYPYAKVVPRAVVDLGPRVVDITFAVDPGIQCKIGEVRFEGMGGLPEPLIRRTFSVEAGERYAADELEFGRKAIVDLGVFASVDVIPDLSDPHRAVVPIKVVVAPATLRSFRLGGGVLIDSTRADVHGLVGWEHRNLFGGMRRFSVEEKPSVVLFPTSISAFKPPTRLLPANALSATLSQPSFPEARTTSSIRLEFNNYPILLSPVDENAKIFPGYNELRAVIGPDRDFPSLNIHVALLYNFQANFPFSYSGHIDVVFRRVIASYLDLKTSLDLRDDPVQTTQGFLLENSLQYAGGLLGGDADDVRIRPSMRMFVPVLPGVVLAGRGMLGLVVPRGYGSTLGTDFTTKSPADAVTYVRDLQLTYFRGFFSGGADSNRGYGYRDIGPHGVNPLVVPGNLMQAQAQCMLTSKYYTTDLCQRASGGLSLWEASLEIRIHVVGDLGTVVFLDASDVSPKQLDIRLMAPHLSAGFGIRYATPVGPLRADIGFRLPGLQTIGREPDPLIDGPIPGNLLGLPMAIAIGLGEAY